MKRRSLRINGAAAKLGALAAVLALGVAAASALAGSNRAGSSADRTDAATPTPVPPPSVTPEPPLRQQIVSVATSGRFADTYGGAEVLPDGKLRIYVANDGIPAMRSALEEAFGMLAADAYVLEPVRHDYADLHALMMRIVRDRAWQQQNGFGVTDLPSVGPDERSNTVEIKVNGYTPGVAQKLEARYGSGWVTVVPNTDPPLKTL